MKTTKIIKTDQDILAVSDVLTIGIQMGMVNQVDVQEYKSNRTVAQNSLMWLWLACMRDYIFEHTGNKYTTEAIHAEMKESFLEPIVHQLKNKTIVEYSTRNLSTKKFTIYLEKLDIYSADNLHLVLPHPIDLFNEAMGR